MPKKCKSCGAPIDLIKNEEYIKCNFCGTVNHYQSLNQIINNFFQQSSKSDVSSKSKLGVFIGNRRATKKETVLILAFVFGMLALGIVIFVIYQI